MLSADVDLFSDDDEDLSELVWAANLDQTHAGLHLEPGFELNLKKIILIPILVSVQTALIAAATRVPLPFPTAAGGQDAAEVLSPSAIHIAAWLGARIMANATNRLLTD